MASPRFADSAELEFLFNPSSSRRQPNARLVARLELLGAVQKTLALTSPYANYVAALLEGLDYGVRTDSSKSSFELQLAALVAGDGPYSDLNRNIVDVYGPRSLIPGREFTHRVSARSADSDNNSERLIGVFDSFAPKRVGGGSDSKERDTNPYRQMLRRARARVRSVARKVGVTINLKTFEKSMDRPFAAALHATAGGSENSSTTSTLRMFVNSSVLQAPLLDLLCDVFGLEPRGHWREALRVEWLPAVGTRSIWPHLLSDDGRSAAGSGTGSTDRYFVATRNLFRLWLERELSNGANSTASPQLQSARSEPEALSLVLVSLVRGNKSAPKDLKDILNHVSGDLRDCLVRSLLLRSQRRTSPHQV